MNTIFGYQERLSNRGILHPIETYPLLYNTNLIPIFRVEEYNLQRIWYLKEDVAYRFLRCLDHFLGKLQYTFLNYRFILLWVNQIS